MLARVRRSLRAVNSAIQRGSTAVGVTMQQQAVLLALAAYGGRQVPLADVREELEMDMATASVLLARMVRDRLVIREKSADRRAADLSLTPKGWTAFRRSIDAIRKEMRWAAHRGELAPITEELRRYLRFYLDGGGRAPQRLRDR